MKLKFRRKKPPLIIMTKGDQKPKPITKIAYQLPGGGILKHVEDFTPAETFKWREASINASLQRAKELEFFFCPLCKQPMTMDNIHSVSLNGKLTMIHKTCPEVR